MNNNLIHDRLVDSLFKTSALKICDESKPFWYTSGRIGPYYINTHFLYGSEDAANKLLKLIDQEAPKPKSLHDKVSAEVSNYYKCNTTYKTLIDDMISFIKGNIDLNTIKYISGGERRDWFFSIIIAELLNIPHITIFKDLSMKLLFEGDTSDVTDLNGAKVLHIADLITEASSYVRAWIPAIESINGTITDSLVVVDRKQGGSKVLEDAGVNSFSLVGIDIELFNKALSLGYINKAQYEMVSEYLEDADKAMKKFLGNNPNFISDSLNSDERTKQRAELCLEKKLY